MKVGSIDFTLDKQEYEGDDVVQGVVEIDIYKEGLTAKNVQLKLVGKEAFKWGYTVETADYLGDFKVIQNRNIFLLQKSIIYTFDESIAIGKYRFPFKVKLQNLPLASFRVEGSKQTAQDFQNVISVSYKVKCTLKWQNL